MGTYQVSTRRPWKTQPRLRQCSPFPLVMELASSVPYRASMLSAWLMASPYVANWLAGCQLGASYDIFNKYRVALAFSVILRASRCPSVRHFDTECATELCWADTEGKEPVSRQMMHEPLRATCVLPRSEIDGISLPRPVTLPIICPTDIHEFTQLISSKIIPQGFAIACVTR